jgi:hypothetical protein
MTRQNTSELLNALGPALRATAKNVLEHTYGHDGLPWGTRFTDAEDGAVQVGERRNSRAKKEGRRSCHSAPTTSA